MYLKGNLVMNLMTMGDNNDVYEMRHWKPLCTSLKEELLKTSLENGRTMHISLRSKQPRCPNDCDDGQMGISREILSNSKIFPFGDSVDLGAFIRNKRLVIDIMIIHYLIQKVSFLPPIHNGPENTCTSTHVPTLLLCTINWFDLELPCGSLVLVFIVVVFPLGVTLNIYMHDVDIMS